MRVVQNHIQRYVMDDALDNFMISYVEAENITTVTGLIIVYVE